MKKSKTVKFTVEAPAKEPIHIYPTFGKEHIVDGGPCWCLPEKIQDETPEHSSIWLHHLEI